MISFVYFDVGGVVMQDFSGTNKWHELMHDLRIPDNKKEAFNRLMTSYRPKISTGLMTLDDEIDGARQKLQLQIPTDYSLLDDLVNRFEQNPSIWPVIADIHKTHKVGLLTNMFVGMLDKIKSQHLLPNEPWDIIIDSSIVHLKKPDKAIFEFAQKQADVPHNEILFIDNLLENIQAAEALGWQTFLYDSTNPEESSQKLLSTFTKNQ
ncbi:MAG: HAD-IA family hydrolase [Candidatus Gottesmanbacteria bacterium]